MAMRIMNSEACYIFWNSVTHLSSFHISFLCAAFFSFGFYGIFRLWILRLCWCRAEFCQVFVLCKIGSIFLSLTVFEIFCHELDFFDDFVMNMIFWRLGIILKNIYFFYRAMNDLNEPNFHIFKVVFQIEFEFSKLYL